MNLKHLSLCLVSLFLFTQCQHESVEKHEGDSHHKSSGETHEENHHAGTLNTSSPVQKDTMYFDHYVSQIQAHQHIELKALEEGYLQNVLVDEGQLVEKGQLLFEIQPTIYLAEIQKAKAELAQAEAEREKATIEVKNLQALADSNIISVNELALAKAELQKTEAQVENARAELNLMEAHLEFTMIRAPFSGRIGRFEEIRLGSLLEEGEKLTTLTDNSQMWVYFNVPESVYLDYVQHPTETPELQLLLANNQKFDHRGKITAVQAVFDNSTGTLAFRATFQNPERVLRHGQTGNILWPIELHDALFIPQKATFEVLEKRFVFLVDDEGNVTTREVKVAAELDNVYAISEGLSLNDRYLLEGLRKVKNGDKIEFAYVPPDQVFNSLKLHAE